jgi:hypothetical protein
MGLRSDYTLGRTSSLGAKRRSYPHPVAGSDASSSQPSAILARSGSWCSPSASTLMSSSGSSGDF